VTTIITKQLRDPVPRPRDVLGDPLFPRALDDLILRLCARSAEQRPEHAGLVRDELRLLAQRQVGAATAIAEHAGSQLLAARKQLASLPKFARLLLAAAVAGSALALVVVLSRSTPESLQPAAASLTHSSAQGVVKPKPVEQEAQALQPAPSLADRALQFAERIVNDAPLVPAPQASIPKELEADAKTLLEGPRVAVRRRAANNILRYKGGRLPPYLLAVARLERARTCGDRQQAIAEIEDTQDKRALPALSRIVEASRTGCGFLGLSDCYGCVRADARDALGGLKKR
jgi:hypothetical protein